MSHLVQGLHMPLTLPHDAETGLEGSRRPPGGASRGREGGKGVRRLALCGAARHGPTAYAPLSRPLPQPCRRKPLRVTIVPQLRESTPSSPKTINTNFNTVCSLQGGWLGRRCRPAEREPQPPPARPPRPSAAHL